MARSKLLVFTLTLALTIAVITAGSIRTKRANPVPQIPREFQNVNIESYLKNKRAMRFQLKCVTGEGPCDAIGKYLKKSIPETLTTECKQCTQEQRQQAGKIVGYIQQNYKEEWNAILRKFRGGISDEEIKRFENDFSVNIDSNNGTTQAPISLDEVKSIIKDFKTNLNTTQFITPKPGTKEYEAAQALEKVFLGSGSTAAPRRSPLAASRGSDNSKIPAAAVKLAEPVSVEPTKATVPTVTEATIASTAPSKPNAAAKTSSPTAFPTESEVTATPTAA